MMLSLYLLVQIIWTIVSGGILYKAYLEGAGTLEKKAEPRPLEKMESMPKLTVWVKKSYLRVIISNMTKVFENWYPKIPKVDIFGFKFKDLHFCIKLFNKINSMALISNMIIAFQNCTPKHPNKFLDIRIFIFAQNFALRKHGEWWFQIWQ